MDSMEKRRSIDVMHRVVRRRSLIRRWKKHRYERRRRCREDRVISFRSIHTQTFLLRKTSHEPHVSSFPALRFLHRTVHPSIDKQHRHIVRRIDAKRIRHHGKADRRNVACKPHQEPSESELMRKEDVLLLCSSKSMHPMHPTHRPFVGMHGFPKKTNSNVRSWKQDSFRIALFRKSIRKVSFPTSHELREKMLLFDRKGYEILFFRFVRERRIQRRRHEPIVCRLNLSKEHHLLDRTKESNEMNL